MKTAFRRIWFSSLSLLVLIFAASFTVACMGEKVEVPPAHVGKILSKNGFLPEIIPPSKFRLPRCIAYCQRLILLEAADVPFAETMTIFMPEDELNVTLELRGTLAILNSEEATNPIFDRVIAGDDKKITVSEVYATYVEQVTRGVVRNTATNHNIAWILKNRGAFAEELFAAVREKLLKTGSPIEVSRMELADFQPPEEIITAQKTAKTREIDIQQAEAEARVQMQKAAGDLEVAKKQRLVEKEKALAIAEQNKIAASSVTAQLLAYRRLEVIEKLAESGNTIFFPINMSDGAFDSAFTSELIRRKK